MKDLEKPPLPEDEALDLWDADITPAEWAAWTRLVDTPKGLWGRTTKGEVPLRPACLN